MLKDKRQALMVPALLLAVVFVISPCLGQDASDGNLKKLRDQWSDFLHYIRLGKPELAKSFGQALIAEASDEQVYRLSVESKQTQSILLQGSSFKDLKATIDAIRTKIDKGFVKVRADEKEIKRTLAKLGGNTRQYVHASERLIVSGEYALPLLMESLTSKTTSVELRERISELLPRIGKDAVRGLAETLQSTNPRVVQYAAAALGRIYYGHSVAQLKEAYDNCKLDSVRETIASALVTCSGGDKSVLEKSTASLYYKLALDYYYRRESLLPDSRFNTANVWNFKNGVLVYTQVPGEIFCDIYAMRMARKALELDPNYTPAVSLWLSAYLRRELELPKGKVDPLLDSNQPNAGDFVRASGAKYAQQVLARALKDGDVGVVLGAIEAMRDVAGASNLVKTVNRGESQPLVQAATSPHRRVRFLAAEVLALALPANGFNGSQVVIPALADALRQTGAKRVLVVSREDQYLNKLKGDLRGAEFEVVVAQKPLRAIEAIGEAGGVDAAIVRDAEMVARMVSLLRRDPSLTNLPVVALAQGAQTRKLAERDKTMVVLAPQSPSEEVIASLAKAKDLSGSQQLTPQETAEWAVRAAKALRMLGLTNNKVYDISLAQKSLIAALDDSRSDVRVAAAQALAVQSAAAAQQAIAKLAGQSDLDGELRQVIYKALGESVRRFGNKLTEEQAQGIVDVVNSKADKAIRQAAAQVLGALSLPSDQIKPLILGTGSID